MIRGNQQCSAHQSENFKRSLAQTFLVMGRGDEGAMLRLSLIPDVIPPRLLWGLWRLLNSGKGIEGAWPGAGGGGESVSSPTISSSPKSESSQSSSWILLASSELIIWITLHVRQQYHFQVSCQGFMVFRNPTF